MFLEARSLKSMCWQGCAPLKGSIGESSPCLLQLLVAAAIFDLWLPDSDLCLGHHIASSSSLCLLLWESISKSFCLSIMKLHMIPFRAHPVSPG